MKCARLFIDPRLEAVRKRPADIEARRKVHRELEQFCGKPIEKIADDFWLRTEQEKELYKRIADATSEAEVTGYYASTDKYLYELANRETKKSQVERFRKAANLLSCIGARKVLDYGGGIGGLVISLRKRGFECDYLDVPGPTFNFALFRFKENGVTPGAFDATRDVQPDNYDAVLAMDSFEHLFDLESAVRKISCLLREGGYLIQSSVFRGGGIHLPKNEIYSDLSVLNSLLLRYSLCHVKQERRFIQGLLARIMGKTAPAFLIVRRRCQIARSIVIHRKLSRNEKDDS
jgi:2-polyprenyl-3-methyl-5-hydroxy-6-metoxy-1,4-benzoquinol methylase